MNKRAMAFLVLGVVIVAAAAAAVLNWNSERGRGDSVAGVSRADSALHDGAGDADSDASRASMQNGKTASEAVIPGADASFPGHPGPSGAANATCRNAPILQDGPGSKARGQASLLGPGWSQSGSITYRKS